MLVRQREPESPTRQKILISLTQNHHTRQKIYHALYVDLNCIAPNIHFVNFIRVSHIDYQVYYIGNESLD